MDSVAQAVGDCVMTYRIELSSQGGKPYAYYDKPDRMQADDCANRLRKKFGDVITITVKESN